MLTACVTDPEATKGSKVKAEADDAKDSKKRASAAVKEEQDTNGKVKDKDKERSSRSEKDKEKDKDRERRRSDGDSERRSSRRDREPGNARGEITLLLDSSTSWGRGIAAECLSMTVRYRLSLPFQAQAHLLTLYDVDVCVASGVGK